MQLLAIWHIPLLAVVPLFSLALCVGLMRRLPTSSCHFPFPKKPLTLFYIICTLPVVDLPPSLHMHESSFMFSGLTIFEMPAPPLYYHTNARYDNVRYDHARCDHARWVLKLVLLYITKQIQSKMETCPVICREIIAEDTDSQVLDCGNLRSKPNTRCSEVGSWRKRSKTTGGMSLKMNLRQ